MNLDDLLAQQQAYMNQMMQNAQHTQWALLAVWVASLLISVCVICLFYARLRDIADELRKLRIAFEMSEGRAPQASRLGHLDPPPATIRSPLMSATNRGRIRQDEA